MGVFRVREATLNLKTGEVTDVESGEVQCLCEWTHDIDREWRDELDRLQKERDPVSEIINLPGEKPLFEEDYGLVPVPTNRRQDPVCQGHC